MAMKDIIACTFLCVFMCPDVHNGAEIKTPAITDTQLHPKSTKEENGSTDIAKSILVRTHPKLKTDKLRQGAVEDNENIKTDANEHHFSIADTTDKIDSGAKAYTSKSLYPIAGLIVPQELSSVVKSPDELIALLNSPKLLSALSTVQLHALITVLTSSPGLLTTLRTSAIVNVITTLCSSPEPFAKLSRPTLYSLLTIFTVRPNLFDSLPTTLAIQFTNNLFSLSPGVLYNVPTHILVNFVGWVCSPVILSSLSEPQTVNFLSLLSLSAPLVKGLPVSGLVSLVDFMATERLLLTRLQPSTLYSLARGLFDTISDSSFYLMDDGPMNSAVVRLFAVLLVPHFLNHVPSDTFNSLLAILWSSPPLTAIMPANGMAALLSVIVKSPNLLVSVNTSHLDGILNTIVSNPALLKSIPQQYFVDLMNNLATYLPNFVSSMPKSTLSKLLNIDLQA